MLRYTVLVLLVLLTVVVGSFAQVSFPYHRVEDVVHIRQSDTPGFRLPNNTRPEHYDIQFTTRPDIEDFIFTGTVRISIVTLEPSIDITLHHRELNILSVELWSTANPPQQIPLGGRDYVLETEKLTIQVLSTLPTNTRYTLVIQYSGTLRTNNRGLYRSSYVIDGERRYLATTQFESTDARHGFPSYDEPQLKATYKIRITHGPTHRALSNMPPSTPQPVTNPDGSVTTEFDETPLTSTYLIAFIVSDFEYLQNFADSHIPHRAISRPNAVDQNHLILDAGVRILDAIADYVSVNYTLPKMDQVAVPDFAPGAMENWGLVTYREERFFWNEAVHTYTTKTSIITVIAHEFGHQWFGNLVGPKWWTYIWLNEGFANLFEHIGVDLVYPDWKIMDYYVVNTMHSVFSSDASDNTRPMTYYAESPAAVSSLFDNIAYAKSGCVLRMFLHAFTETTFKRGLTYYLQARQFSDAAEEDLFDGLSRAVTEDAQLAAGLSVHEIMASWTNQRGFPLLTVTRNYETGAITLSQARYQAVLPPVTDPTIFSIPYNYITSSESNSFKTRADYWLTSRSTVITPANLNADDWILFNNLQSGYYRVQYDTRNYELIADALFGSDLDKFHAVTRAQLIDDAYNFVLTNRLTYTHYLHLIRYLRNETEYVPWAAAVPGITLLNRMFSGNEEYPRFADFIGTRTEQLIRSVGVNDIGDEPHWRKYARPVAINWACNMGSEYCHTEATGRLRQLMQNNVEFHQNVRSVLYCAALRNASDDEYDFVWTRLVNSNDAALRTVLITALGCTKKEDQLQNYLNSSLNSTNTQNVVYPNADRLRVFNAVYQSGPVGLEMALKYLIVHVAEARDTFGLLNGVITGMAQRVLNAERRAEFETLLDIVQANGYAAEANINTAKNTVASNTAWVAEHGGVITEWLLEHHNGSIRFSLSLMAMVVVLVNIFNKFL